MRRAQHLAIPRITSSTPSTRTNRTTGSSKSRSPVTSSIRRSRGAGSDRINRHFPDESNARKLLESRQEILNILPIP